MDKRMRVGRREFLKAVAGLAGAGLVAGCQSGSTSVPTEEPTAAPSATATSTPEPTAMPTPTPTPGSTIRYADRACVFRTMIGGFPNQGVDDYLVKQYQEEQLRNEYGINVDIQVESASWADIDALMNLRLQIQGTESLQSGPQRVLRWMAVPGLVPAIGDEISEYGAHLLDQVPAAAWQYFSMEGVNYVAIPSPRVVPAEGGYIHIRRDWLQQIERDMPATIEELEECLRLFLEQELGGEETIPFAVEGRSELITSTLAGPWVPSPEQQSVMMEEGRPIDRDFGALMIPERLETFKRWATDGLLDPDWATRPTTEVRAMCADGQVGVLAGNWRLLNGFLHDEVEANDDEQDWVQVFPPVGRAGAPETACTLADSALERGIVILSWAECPEALVALADWENTTLENFITCRYGLQGKHWQWGEGGWIEDLRSPGADREYSGRRRVTWTARNRRALAELPPQPGNEPKNPAITPSMYTSLHTREQAHIPQDGEYPTTTQIDHWCPYPLLDSGKDQDEMLQLRDEAFISIVSGDVEPVDGIETFWNDWYAVGGEVRQREVSDTYAAWIARHPEWQDPKAIKDPSSWRTERPLAPTGDEEA